MSGSLHIRMIFLDVIIVKTTTACEECRLVEKLCLVKEEAKEGEIREWNEL